MKVICGWCRADMGEKPGPVNEVSHGMCEACQKEMEEQMPGCFLNLEQTIQQFQNDPNRRAQ